MLKTASFILAAAVLFADAGSKPAPLLRAERAVSAARAGKPGERVLDFSEAELNEVLTYLIRKERKVKVSFARIKLTGERNFTVSGEAEVGDYLLGKLDSDAEGLFGKAMRKLLKSSNRVEAGGYFFGVRGKGFGQVQWVRLNGREIPQSWVKKILALVGRNQKPPIDFNRLFPLERGIEKVELKRGTVRLTLSGPPSPRP